MNLRLFTIAILISALPIAAHALGLNSGDFVAAERVNSNGDTVVKVKLSKSGKAKFKKLNQTSVNRTIHTEIAGVAHDFKLRVPIIGDDMEIGPYSATEADKVISEINHYK